MSRHAFVRAKCDALALMNPEGITGAFRFHLRKRYGVSEDNVVFMEDDARRRISNATLLSCVESREREDEISGETDMDGIRIIRGMEHDHTVMTLLHEAMHDSVFVTRATRNGCMRGLTECDEHRVIYALIPP